MSRLESFYDRPKLEVVPRAPKGRDTAKNKYLGFLCQKLGIKPSDIASSEIPERWQELGQSTKVLEDELQAVIYLESAVFFLQRYFPDRNFTSEEISTIKTASLLTDVSKTGWSGATLAERAVITKIYAEDRHFDTRRTLREFVDSFFEPEEANTIKKSLARMTEQGVTPDMTFREFINLHAGWSYEIIRRSKLPEKIARTAALHHFLEGVLPVDFDLERSDPNTLLTREAIWVIILDKYDAQRRRGKAEHTKAIEWLYQYVTEDFGGGLAKIPNDTQRAILQKRFTDAIFELDQSLAEKKKTKEAA